MESDMSNLNLGNVSFSGLKKRFSRTGRKGRAITLAYATTADLVEQDGSTDEYIVIRHHGSVIAEVAEGWVYVTNAGYGTSTTRTRINAVLSGNDVPLYVSQKQYKQCLFQVTPVLVDGIGEHVLISDAFRSIHWDRITGEYSN